MKEVLNHYDSKNYSLYSFEIMPDHIPLLIKPFEALEIAVQLFKGGFSFRAKREFQWSGDTWQPGFTGHGIRDKEDWANHVEYIRQNPVRALLTADPARYRFMNISLREFPQGLKPHACFDP